MTDVILMPFYMYTEWLLTFIALMGFFILTILLAAMTPSPSFLKAKLRGKAIAMAWRPDNKIDFSIANTFVQDNYGMLDTKFGAFMVDKRAASPEKKSGVTVYPVNPSIGITLDKYIIQKMNTLKDKGFNDIQAAEWLDSHTFKCTSKKEVETDKGDKLIKECEWRGELEWNTPDEVKALKCPVCDAGVDTLQPLGLSIRDNMFKTIDFSDIQRYFKYNYNPNMIISTIERKVQDERSKDKAFPVKWIAIGIMVFLILLGAMIVIMFAAPIAMNYAASTAGNIPTSTPVTPLPVNPITG